MRVRLPSTTHRHHPPVAPTGGGRINQMKYISIRLCVRPRFFSSATIRAKGGRRLPRRVALEGDLCLISEPYESASVSLTKDRACVEAGGDTSTIRWSWSFSPPSFHRVDIQMKIQRSVRLKFTSSVISDHGISTFFPKWWSSYSLNSWDLLNYAVEK